MQNDSIATVRTMRDKDMRRVLLALVAEHGHTVVATRNGHYRVLHRDGVGQVTMGGTPSDRRAFRNTLAQMRRAGFEV